MGIWNRFDALGRFIFTLVPGIARYLLASGFPCTVQKAAPQVVKGDNANTQIYNAAMQAPP